MPLITSWIKNDKKKEKPLKLIQEEEKEESRKFFDYESDSEFYRVAKEVEPAHLMATLDELVGCVQILDARLYQTFIQKLKGEEE